MEVVRDMFLVSECGNGHSEVKAVDDYIRRISNEYIRISLGNGREKRVDVPRLTFNGELD